jgi:hypothetical protein
MSASLMPSKVFHRCSIYWKSASYRSYLDLSSFGKTTNRSAAKLICYFFGPTCMLFDLLMASRLCLDPLEVDVPTHRSGLVIHGYPGSPPTSLPAVPDKWVWPIRRPADLSVGLSDLTCWPEEEKTSWCASQGSPDGLRQLR